MHRIRARRYGLDRPAVIVFAQNDAIRPRGLERGEIDLTIHQQVIDPVVEPHVQLTGLNLADLKLLESPANYGSNHGFTRAFFLDSNRHHQDNPRARDRVSKIGHETTITSTRRPLSSLQTSTCFRSFDPKVD